MAVDRSELITCLAEAREYYAERLARSHQITRSDRRVDIVFEAGATHLFSESEENASAIPAEERVERSLGGGKTEVRRFSLERARLMDRVLPALSNFIVSTSGQNGNRLVHGPALPDGRHMRVALRFGPGAAMTCLSAYPVSKHLVADARNSKPARFPP